MKYTSATFIKPPRAETAISGTLFPFYEKRGWIAQYKKNGTNSIIAVSPDKKLTAWTRHGEPHKQWNFTEGSRAIFNRLPEGWHVINAELIHSKTPTIKDTHYIHDILVTNGKYLIGLTYAQRYKILQDLFLHNPLASMPSHFVLDKHSWLVKNVRENFGNAFKSINTVEDEGLVLKDPTGILSLQNNSSWLVKARKPHKNYSF
jgi:hypothetical protein